MPGVYVGATRAAKRAGLNAPASRSGETFVRGAIGADAIAVQGGTPLGTRQGVAELVRTSLGVEFLTPGEHGADWAPRLEWTVPAARSEYRPTYAWRAITHGETPAEREWCVNNGLGALPAMNHAIHEIFDARAWAENPAYFPLVGGVRVAPAGRGGYEPQPNLAHPLAAEYAAGRVGERLEKTPNVAAVSLCINDTMTWDESPESLAAFGPERWFRGRRNRTDYVFRFMNGVAERLQDGPWRDKLLTAYAYFECEAPPAFPVHRAVFPILTADRSEWRDSAFEAEDRAVMRDWANSGCATFGLYDYYYGRPMTMPRFFYREQAASIKHGASLGASLFFAEMNPTWGLDAPKAWLAALLSRDASADPEAALTLYFARAYGKAAPAMRRFHSIVEARWRERTEPPRWIRFFREESAAELFPPEIRRELDVCMLEARRAVALPADARERRMRMRVLEAALAWSKCAAAADWYEAKRSLASLPRAFDESDAGRLLAAYTRCARAESAYRDAAALAYASPWNPGGDCPVDYYFNGSVLGLAAYKCDGYDVAGLDSRLVRVLAQEPGAGVEVLTEESFEANWFDTSFGERVGTGGHAVTARQPWVSQHALGRSGRFGPDSSCRLTGAQSLRIESCEQAGAVRRFAVAAADGVGAKVSYSGKITPGEHVALTLRFVDARGARVGPLQRCVAFPGGDMAWRTLAVAGVAPAGSVAVEVSLRVTAQDAGDAVNFDDLWVRRLPAAVQGTSL